MLNIIIPMKDGSELSFGIAEIRAALTDAARYQHLRNKHPDYGIDVQQWNDRGSKGVQGEALDKLVDEELRAAGTL